MWGNRSISEANSDGWMKNGLCTIILFANDHETMSTNNPPQPFQKQDFTQARSCSRFGGIERVCGSTNYFQETQ